MLDFLSNLLEVRGEGGGEEGRRGVVEHLAQHRLEGAESGADRRRAEAVCDQTVREGRPEKNVRTRTNRSFIHKKDGAIMPPSREALRHSGGDSLLFTSAMVTLYLEVELSSDRRPGRHLDLQLQHRGQRPPTFHFQHLDSDSCPQHNYDIIMVC
ncbi:hypothetical protein EYF80_030566 [Liparis tanakae]|uniref:Uncharacterized protein n=1 Tax=Liparis tanakae TaxID=230148 RepID=A0A4Z2H280_9TELE|nr:hypothetical protein EYF80_030566 [Liparis tanakae]